LPNGGVATLLGRAGRHQDLLLAALLMAIVGLFVLPLPTPLLDLLIAANLAMSLVLLIVAMYVPSALSLSTFPSLLLFTTLFRLALNIASTKLILLHAHAGHIIDTFGKLIVGNNVVVGGVVFLIIAIVQFIVIAKGSERVAEVAARFALDAMPGKQMSIDADVRAGAMSSTQAQKKRSELEQECQLHGAMDGAMKFVKGDAIASIVIAVVNILAGIAIGTLMRDMSIGEALRRFAILTVGDGMVSQIPSLLVSISAGIVITRVGSGGPADQQLAPQIVRQLTAHPRALIISGAAMALFLVVPGFPKWVFALLASSLVGLGVGSLLLRRRQRAQPWITHREGAEASDDAIAAPLAVRLATGLRGQIDRYAVDHELALVKARVESDLGPVFPRLHVSAHDAVAESGYQVLVQDVVVAQGQLRPGWLLQDPVAGDGAVPEGAQAGEPFGPFQRVLWLPAHREGKGEAVAGWRSEQVVGLHVEAIVRRHVPQLVGLQEVQKLLHTVQRDAPELAAEVARAVPAQRIAEVLRRLLQEGIPVRNLHAIFESLATWAPKEADAVALTELVRIDLGRYITSRFVGASRQLDAILFESSLLSRVHESVERSPRGNLLLLSPAVTQDIREQVRRILASCSGPVVAIASSDARRYVKNLVEPVAPALAVLSYQEIDDDVALQPVGWVTNPSAA
jgi:type III secretion protein V